MAGDQPPFPTTLFLVDTDEEAETGAGTASRMTATSLLNLVSYRAVPSGKWILGRSWHCGSRAPGSRAACAKGRIGWRQVIHADTLLSPHSVVRGRNQPLREWLQGLAGRRRWVIFAGFR